MMRGRPAVYATFSSYDEVAHHSGLERAGHARGAAQARPAFRPDRAGPPLRAAALRARRALGSWPDAGRDVQAAQRLRPRRPRRAVDLERARVERAAGDESDAMVSHAIGEATGTAGEAGDTTSRERACVVLASGNLGLIYLMEEPRRLSLEEIEERHPRAARRAARAPARRLPDGPLARARARRLSALRRDYLAEQRIVGEDPLAPLLAERAAPPAADRRLHNAPDILVNSFYDPTSSEGCAFEELISFHGGLGGPQTRPFILHPVALEVPDEPIVGAATCTRCSWAGVRPCSLRRGARSRGRHRRRPRADAGRRPAASARLTCRTQVPRRVCARSGSRPRSRSSFRRP